MRVIGQQVLLVETLKASLLTFFSKKVREKGVCGNCPAPTAQQNERQGPHHVIFNARCTRYTMYLNSPAIRLNSTQT